MIHLSTTECPNCLERTAQVVTVDPCGAPIHSVECGVCGHVFDLPPAPDYDEMLPWDCDRLGHELEPVAGNIDGHDVFVCIHCGTEFVCEAVEEEADVEDYWL